MTRKNKDLTLVVNNKTAEIGNVDTNFYTEDKGIASFRFIFRYDNSYIDLVDSGFVPQLDLFHSDGSIWINQPLIMVMPKRGLVQYSVKDNVIVHAGKVDAKVFLKRGNESIHVANFNFNIIDSGITGAVEKEISVNLIEDTIRNIIQEESIEVLDEDFVDSVSGNVIEFVSNNPDNFKGVKGDKGDKGDIGAKGDKGDQGPKGEQGIQGIKGDRGLQGVQGPKGDRGTDGVDGVVTFEELTEEQRESLRGIDGEQGPQGPQGPQGDTGEQGLQGPQGDRGQDGTQGNPGTDGKDSTQINYKDIKIHADLPIRFSGYDQLITDNSVSYYYPQGLALDDDYIYLLYDTPELVNRLLVIYDWDYNFVVKYYVGTHGGENIHVEIEGNRRYLYAKTTTTKLGKFDISNIEPSDNTVELLPTTEYEMSIYTNFFRTREGWGIEARNLVNGGGLRRDTIVFYNNDFSKMTGHLWMNPTSSLLWASTTFGTIMQKSTKRQGLTLIGNNIMQTVGGQWNPNRDTKTEVYHLQGVQQIGPSGEVVDNFTYPPQEMFNYLQSIGKTPTVVEHESAFNYNGRLFCLVVCNGPSATGANTKGILLVEYGAKDKDYTFKELGVPYVTPTAQFYPYKTGISGKLYNEYTGAALNTLQEVVEYMYETAQSQVIWYSSDITVKDFSGNDIESGNKISVENLNNYTFFVNYEARGDKKLYIVTRNTTTGNKTIVAGNINKKYTSIDLLDLTEKFEGYSVGTINRPTGVSASGWVESSVIDDIKRVKYKPYNEHNEYVNIKVSGVWQGWKKITAT